MKTRINIKRLKQRSSPVVHYLNKLCRIIKVSMTKPEQPNVTRPVIKLWESETEKQPQSGVRVDGSAAFASSLPNTWGTHRNTQSNLTWLQGQTRQCFVESENQRTAEWLGLEGSSVIYLQPPLVLLLETRSGQHLGKGSTAGPSALRQKWSLRRWAVVG